MAGAYRTPNNDVEHVWSTMKRMWKNAPDEMKRNYTEDYLEKGKKRGAVLTLTLNMYISQVSLQLYNY